MSEQSLEPLKIHEDFLSEEQFTQLIADITQIQNKFKSYRNQHFNYDRIFLNDYFTDNPIQLLTKTKLGELGYNTKDLEMQVTSYTTFQAYNWHDDDDFNRSHNYILYLTDQQWFEGGELDVKIDGKIQTIVPKKNMLVVMDAKLQHRVLPIKTKIGGMWQLSRLTLNGHIKSY